MIKKMTDDYLWDSYTNIYKNQCYDVMYGDKVNFILEKTNKIIDGKIQFEDNIYPSWKNLYQTVVDINPPNIFECGCGPAYHLYNIQKLLPTIETFGCDLLADQIYLGVNLLKIPESFYDNIYDFSEPNIYKEFNSTYHTTFTHTVTQHLRHEKCINFIKNMIGLTKNYIILVENLNNHNYNEILNDLKLNYKIYKSVILIKL